MTTQQELDELRKKKKELFSQNKIDDEAKKIKSELESRTVKGQLKKLGKGMFKKLMK